MTDLQAVIDDLSDQIRTLSMANDTRKRIRSEIYEKASRYDELLPILKMTEERADFFKSILVGIAMGDKDPKGSAEFALSVYPE